MPIVLDLSQDGPPKRHIIELAFSECAMAGYEFGRTPEEVNDALLRLNGMMAEWKALRGIDLGYDQPDQGVGTADELSGIPLEAMNVIASFLALRIAPMMGAALSSEAKGNLVRSLVLLEAHYFDPTPMPHDAYTPAGAGNHNMLLGPFMADLTSTATGTGA